MNNTIDLQATNLFEELDDAELVAVCGGISANVSVDANLPTSANSSNRGFENGILVVSADTNVAV